MNNYTHLSDLFVLNKRLLAYNQNDGQKTNDNNKLADINNDGKIDKKDEKLIKKAIEKKEAEKIFDFNNDGKTNIDDWFCFSTEIDLDNDGIVSEEEKQFLQTQQQTMKNIVEKSIKTDKYTGKYTKTTKSGSIIEYTIKNGKRQSAIKTYDNGDILTYTFKNNKTATIHKVKAD